MKTLWKSMKAGMLSGSGDIGPWKVGKWRTHDKPLKMCESGFHASIRAIDAMRYINCEIMALVEVDGEHLEQGDKQVWEKMRVVKAYRWTKPDSVAMAIFVAELVIGICEKRHPDDKRPRKAIEAAKAWLDNPTEENRRAADSAAYDSACAAYDSACAAYDSAYAAYDSACTAYDSACTAYDSAYAASAAAYAASASSSAAAAASAAARKDTLDKVEAWLQERIKTLEEVVA